MQQDPLVSCHVCIIPIADYSAAGMVYVTAHPSGNQAIVLHPLRVLGRRRQQRSGCWTPTCRRTGPAGGQGVRKRSRAARPSRSARRQRASRRLPSATALRICWHEHRDGSHCNGSPCSVEFVFDMHIFVSGLRLRREIKVRKPASQQHCPAKPGGSNAWGAMLAMPAFACCSSHGLVAGMAPGNMRQSRMRHEAALLQCCKRAKNTQRWGYLCSRPHFQLKALDVVSRCCSQRPAKPEPYTSMLYFDMMGCAQVFAAAGGQPCSRRAAQLQGGARA